MVADAHLEAGVSVLPIPFRPQMIASVRDGVKTQTRRMPRRQPKHPLHGFMVTKERGRLWALEHGPDYPDAWPGDYVRIPYQPGDRLWVRESWRPYLGSDPRIEFQGGGVLNLDRVGVGKLCATVNLLPDTPAGSRQAEAEMAGRRHTPAWRPAMFMPRWMSQTMIEVTKVRVQQVRAITQRDAHAEGFANAGAFLDYAWRLNKAKLQCEFREWLAMWTLAYTFKLVSIDHAEVQRVISESVVMTRTKE
ncbi:MAG: hypothetical protein IT435_15980 [Phycisphaerales bacterium]|nr:hypothetical protein [Phycisphaerales bacterium]